jgi:hypothetical protein
MKVASTPIDRAMYYCLNKISPVLQSALRAWQLMSPVLQWTLPALQSMV